jgi:hypothetical protein
MKKQVYSEIGARCLEASRFHAAEILLRCLRGYNIIWHVAVNQEIFVKAGLKREPIQTIRCDGYHFSS